MTKITVFKRIYCALIRYLKQTDTGLRGLTPRKKLMFLTLLMVAANYYSAPAGMIFLSVGLAVEWKRSPERSLSFWYIAKKSIFLIPGMILLLSAVIGPVYHGNYFNAGLAAIVLGPVLFCAAAIEVLWQKEDMLHFARYAGMLIVPLALISFLFPWSGTPVFSNLSNLRIAATFSNPNYFAYILEMILLFSAALYYHIWRKADRAWLLLSTALSVLCLYFTGSRMGMLAFFVGITVFYLCMSEKPVLVLIFSAVTLLLVGTALFPEQAVDLFRDLIPRPETFLSEINNRFLLWDVALKQIAADPLMGTGLDTYRLLIPKNAPPVLLYSTHCHNIFINMWLETGLFGILAFVWIPLRAGYTAIRRLPHSPVRPYLSAGIGMVAVMAVHGMTDATLLSSQTLSFFVLFLAGLVVMNRKTEKF